MPESESTPQPRAGASPGRAASLRATVASNPLWYHALDLAPGVSTPGWFDHRPVAQGLQWPDVRGKRCLDVGTYDGFFAFELERRGASEVVATDIADHAQWDWPAAARTRGPAHLAAAAGPEKGLGFRIAKEALRSSVERVEVNVYDLAPDRLGTFDVVVCGALMLHLRDPVRALEAIRGVCGGVFLSIEAIDAQLTVLHRRRPTARLLATDQCQWWLPNTAGHRRMLSAAGFELVGESRPYPVPYGPAHQPQRVPAADLRSRAHRERERVVRRMAVGGDGVPHVATLARPLI